MSTIAKFRKRTNWGLQFWLFSARYVAFPWYGWKASMSMRWPKGERMNPVWRMANIAGNYFHVFFVALILALLVRSGGDGEWLTLLLLALGGLPIFMTLIIRLQMSFLLACDRQRLLEEEQDG